jgi:para-nitrobenzyl esterase
MLQRYPSDNLDEAMLATTRDALYGWTAERLVRKQTALGQPSFLYYYNHSYPTADVAGLHAFHASEIPFALGTVDRTPPRWPQIPDTREEKALADAMTGYWSSFAISSVPSAEGQPTWHPYGDARKYMEFEAEPVSGTHLFPRMFELVESVVCRRRAQGDQPWHWNVGIVSPPLPAGATGCP